MVLIVFLVWVLWATRHLFKNVERLDQPSFKKSYGALYASIDVRKGRKALIFITVFCLRRLFVGIVACFGQQHSLMQLFLTALLSHLMLYWQVKVWPMDGARQNALFLLNEYLYLVCICVLMGFSEFNADAERRFELGWFYLAFIGLIIVINVAVLVYEIVKGIKTYCRNKKIQKQRKKI